MQRYTVYLYVEIALHVSGGTSTHHQEFIQLYLQHLVFVTPLLLSDAIVEELELVSVCCGWRTPVKYISYHIISYHIISYHNRICYSNLCKSDNKMRQRLMIWPFSVRECFLVEPRGIATTIISSPTRKKIVSPCMSSGFRREVAESCGLLGYYAVSTNTEERNLSSYPPAGEKNNLPWLRTHGSSQNHGI
jgi:hypothetical protein